MGSQISLLLPEHINLQNPYLLAILLLLPLLQFFLPTLLRRHHPLTRTHASQEPFHTTLPFRLHVLLLLLAGRHRRHVHYLTAYYPRARHHTFRIARSGFVNTIEPANIKTILSTSFKSFSLGPNRYPALGPLLGKGVFTLDGEEWKHSRAMLRPQFKRNEITTGLLDGSLVESTDKFLDLLAENPEDAAPECFKLALDNATEFLFGTSTRSLWGEDNAGFADDFAVAQDWGLIRNRLGRYRDFLTPKHAWGAMNRCKAFVEGFVDKELARRESGEKAEEERYIFLRALAEDTQDRVVLRDQMLNILLAGRDTTAGTLGWTIYLLARHPEVYKKLREECLEAGTAFEDLKGNRYLQHVLNEVLRLYPNVPVNTRTAIEDVILPLGGGPDEKSPILVKKGEQVQYSVYAMHRRTDLWGEDAGEFKPERWEGRRVGWEYLPFNGGPRVCIGQQYALTEIGYTVVRLVGRFKRLEVAGKGVEGGENEEWCKGEVDMSANLTMSPRNVRVRFIE